VSAQKTGDYAAQALAMGEVKGWDVPLGKRQNGGGASFDAQNPSFQVDYYLRATGLQWGMLSNGRLWRLVHAGRESPRCVIESSIVTTPWRRLICCGRNAPARNLPLYPQQKDGGGYFHRRPNLLPRYVYYSNQSQMPLPFSSTKLAPCMP
jgi:hypothetical protein